MNALEFYANNETPPEWALKTIQAGRIKGMTDINPQWRIYALTQAFGFCGIGWKYRIVKMWFEDCGVERVVFVEIELFIKVDGNWSDPIPGIGGSKMMTQERESIHVSDECYKMANTDALSVACKQLGIGGSIYSGSKYIPVIEAKEKEQADKERADKIKAEYDKLKSAIEKMESCKSLDQVKAIWDEFKEIRIKPEFMAAKEKMKTILTK